MKQQLLFALAQFIIDEFTAHKTVIVFIVVGMIAGLIAQLVLPGRGFGLIATAVIGIIGCFLGNMFLVKYITFVDNHVLKEIIGAIAGAMIISLVINLVIPRKPDRAKVR